MNVFWNNWFESMNNFLLRQAETDREKLINFLSTIPKTIVIDDLTDKAINALIEVGDLGSLDAWYNENEKEYYVAIKWIIDIEHWFVGVQKWIYGTWENMSDALIDFRDSIRRWDIVIKVKDWFHNLKYTNTKMSLWSLTVYSDNYKTVLEEYWYKILLNEKSVYQDVIIKKDPWEDQFYIYSNVLYDQEGKIIKIYGNSIEEVCIAFMNSLKSESWIYKNWNNAYWWIRNDNKNNFELNDSQNKII